MSSPEISRNYSQDPSLERIQAVSIEAVLASMRLIRQYQLGVHAIGGSVLKPADMTLVTQVDVLSENAAKSVLAQSLPEIPVIGEELGGQRGNAERFMWLDPIDGTKPFVAGASTSTVMLGSFNVSRKQIESSTIGQPATGIVWQTLGNRAIRQVFDLSTGEPLTEKVACKVWDGEIQYKSIVFVDGCRGFTRGGRQIMDNRQASALHQILQPVVDTQNYGSNGLHQALVANGGERVTGSITTHLGGSWDALGACLVLAAGGSAVGLRVEADRALVPEDPLNPDNYDMLITANNAQSLATIHDSVNRAWAA